MKAEFMTSNGLWRECCMHENNIKKNYYRFKVNRNFDYYRSDDNDMIYRIETPRLKVEDIINGFTITIEAKDIHGRTLLGSRGIVTKKMVDCSSFKVHEEEFKRMWRDITKMAREKNASEL